MLTATFFLVFFVASVAVASAAMIYVPDDYAKIQWAADNATAGDTIIVRDDSYVENVDVNKRLTIRSENGSDLTTVIASNVNDHILDVIADYVNISGFTVTGAGSGNAFYVNNVNNFELKNTTITNSSGTSIYLSGSNSNIAIKNITISDPGSSAI